MSLLLLASKKLNLTHSTPVYDKHHTSMPSIVHQCMSIMLYCSCCEKHDAWSVAMKISMNVLRTICIMKISGKSSKNFLSCNFLSNILC